MKGTGPLMPPGEGPRSGDLNGLERLEARVAGHRTMDRDALRIATFVAILLAHLAAIEFFPALRGPTVWRDAPQSVPIVLLPWIVEPQPAVRPTQPARSAPAPARARKGRPAVSATPPISLSSETAPTPAAPVPDWHDEARIAADDEVQREDQRQRSRSPLDPHDFSKVPHGAVDTSKPQFGWSYSATHRVVELPQGGFIVNINDRCAVAVIIMVFPFCRIGKIPIRGDLFEHMDVGAGAVNPSP